MSSRICHACISFLNSWQSFKNRCYAAQKKQQNFLDLLIVKEREKEKLETIKQNAERERQLVQEKALAEQQKILKKALMSTTPNSNNNSHIDVVS